MASLATSPSITFAELLRVFTRIGFLSFGGPAGQIALMHRELVDEHKWISEEDFLHALNFCHLLPGPEAQQLATWIGWRLHGWRGGLAAGLLFVIPGALIILALSVLYAIAANLAWVEALFLGVKAAVLAIVVQALLRIAGRALDTGLKRGLAAAAFVGLFFFDLPFPLIVLGSGVIGMIAGKRRPDLLALKPATGADAVPERPWRTTFFSIALWGAVWAAPMVLIAATLGREHVLWDIGAFFSQLAVVTFGGAYAVLAYVAQQAVDNYGWVTAGEMLDGLGMAESTPGPLIMVAQFVGFLGAWRDPGGLHPLMAGTLGGLLTTWVTFTPCFLWIFVGAPFVEALRANRALAGALSAITAAVVGVILNLAVWFGLQVLFAELRPVSVLGATFDLPVLASASLPAVALAACCAIAIFRFKFGMVPVLLASSIAGILYALML